VTRPRLLALAGTVLAALAVPAGVAPGQSLGDAARRERERRAREKAPAGAAARYTDADLAGRRSGEAAPEPSPSPGATPRPAPATKPDEESLERQRRETEWRARFEAARERLRQAEEASWRSVVEVVYVAGVPVQQWVRKQEETPSLRDARQALADLEEDFRRTGLPPGWAR
jgi:hypothetical protein